MAKAVLPQGQSDGCTMELSVHKMSPMAIPGICEGVVTEANAPNANSSVSLPTQMISGSAVAVTSGISATISCNAEMLSHPLAVVSEWVKMKYPKLS